jgi:hypothetical protein
MKKRIKTNLGVVSAITLGIMLTASTLAVKAADAELASGKWLTQTQRIVVQVCIGLSFRRPVRKKYMMMANRPIVSKMSAQKQFWLQPELLLYNVMSKNFQKALAAG